MLEVMRRIVIGLTIWNLCLTVGFCFFLSNQRQADLDEKICNEELIPLEVITEEI